MGGGWCWHRDREVCLSDITNRNKAPVDAFDCENRRLKIYLIM